MRNLWTVTNLDFSINQALLIHVVKVKLNQIDYNK